VWCGGGANGAMESIIAGMGLNGNHIKQETRAGVRCLINDLTLSSIRERERDTERERERERESERSCTPDSYNTPYKPFC